MRSATPKVLHPLGGRSMVGHALHAARALDPGRLAVVVRHERDAVAAHVLAIEPDALIVDQDEVPGTGRAVQCALSVLDSAAHADVARDGSGRPGAPAVVEGPVVVLAGDIPLLDADTLGGLLGRHVDGGHAVTVLTTVVPDPAGYGRIVRVGEEGDVERIVEHRDATEAERDISEINSSVYVFDAAALRAGLAGLGRDNAQGEVYLTDVLAAARADGGRVRAVRVEDPELVEGVNDRVQLARLRGELNRRVLERWMRAGVTVVDPASTWVDVTVELDQDVTLLPGTQLLGATTVGRQATIGPDTTLDGVDVGAGATVIRTHGSQSVLGERAVVGPFAYLRPGTRLGDEGKIGTFVETKNAVIGTGSKVPHLSYVGDATIGEHSNIGAASVFVNYDGVHKHHTTIGSHARTGSDTLFVAPVRVGDGAYTAAGSVIRRDVPPGALGLSAAPQRNVEGWVERRRPGTAAAAAAQRAREAAGGEQGGVLGAQAQAERAEAGIASTASRPAPPPHSPGHTFLDDPVPGSGKDLAE